MVVGLNPLRIRSILNLRHPRERVAGIVLGIFCTLVWLIILIPAVISSGFVLVLLFGGLFFFVSEHLQRVQLYSNMLLLSPEQHPELAAVVAAQSQELGLGEPPAVFLANSHGLMNAFALMTLSRRAVILNSALVDFYLRRGRDDELNAVVAHELAHHALGHTKNWWNIFIGVSEPVFIFIMLYLGIASAGTGQDFAWLACVLIGVLCVPLLLARQAYRRICELSCDRLAAHTSQDKPEDASSSRALLGLVAGSNALANANQLPAFLAQQRLINPFFGWLVEVFSEYPLMTSRLSKLQAFIQQQNKSASNSLKPAE